MVLLYSEIVTRCNSWVACEEPGRERERERGAKEKSLKDTIQQIVFLHTHTHTHTHTFVWHFFSLWHTHTHARRIPTHGTCSDIHLWIHKETLSYRLNMLNISGHGWWMVQSTPCPLDVRSWRTWITLCVANASKRSVGSSTKKLEDREATVKETQKERCSWTKDKKHNLQKKKEKNCSDLPHRLLSQLGTWPKMRACRAKAPWLYYHIWCRHVERVVCFPSRTSSLGPQTQFIFFQEILSIRFK